MDDKKFGKLAYPEFPPWLNDIISIKSAVNRLCKWGFERHVDDICSTFVVNMERAMGRNKKISIAYALKSLRNLGIDYWRKEKSEQKKAERASRHLEKEMLAEQKLTLLEQLAHAEDRGLLDKVLNACGLPLRDRVIVKLRCNDIHKFTYGEIGNIVAYSEATARTEFKRISEYIESKRNSVNSDFDKSCMTVTER